MAKIFVIAGHGAGDPGACGNGYTEAERVRALAARIKALGGSSVMLGDTSRNWYADNGISSLTVSKDYQIIELHMDSASASARGGHVIINGNYAADQYDKALASFIGDILPGRANTLVSRTDLANPKRAAAKGYSYRLVEFGFITNAADVSIFNSRMDDIAKGVLNAFGIKASGSAAPASAAASPAAPSGSASAASSAPSGSAKKALGKVNATYCAQTGGNKWWPEVKNMNNINSDGFAGAGDGTPITGIAVKTDKGSVKYRVHVLGAGWLPYVTGYSTKDFINGWAGDGRPIDAVEVYYYTPDGYEYQQAHYRVSPVKSGGYYAWQTDNFTSNGMDGYAGQIGVAFDKFQLYIG